MAVSTGRLRLTPDKLEAAGLKLLAFSASGWLVNSYIAKRRRRRVWGWFDWQLGRYVEEPA